VGVAIFLVAGGAGFIGSNLVEALLGRGERVRVLDDFSTGRRENLAEADRWRSRGAELELIEGDLRELVTCERAVAGADFVLHQAAIPSVPRSVADPLGTNAVNVGGTLTLLEAARRGRVRRFVFASSSSVYGESEVLPKVESLPPEPISPYALQKLAGESYCRLYHRLYGLPTVALRYFNVFGPRQDPRSEYAAVIPRFITAAKLGRPATVYGDGEQTRDFNYVANVVEANLQACAAPDSACGRAYNVAAGERISLNDLLASIGRILERRVTAVHEPARAGDIRHSLASIEAARRALGYEPRIGFAEGLARTIEAL
jgi:nucleoside-diphosphate-sugar epimerase